jgi:uncharacterized membrane protein
MESICSTNHAGKEFMPLLKPAGLILGGYIVAGRTGAVASCLLMELPVWETLLLALCIDFIQIPVYGLLLEATRSRKWMPERIHTRVGRKIDRLQERMKKSSFWRRVARYHPFAVLAVSTIPFRGFGIFSACILAFLIGYGRFYSTILIMSGSFIGAIISIMIFFFPARWIIAVS